MNRVETRLARLEREWQVHHGQQPEPWIPPTRAAVAAFLAPILPIYAACGLLREAALDEAGILARCAAMTWPHQTEEPASLQGYRLLQEVLAACGMTSGGAQ